MTALTYDQFRDAHLARHENQVTSALSTAADVLWIAALPLGLAMRSARVAVGVFSTGSAVAVLAHLFQAGTVNDEVAAVLRRPVWAVRAEAERIRGRR